MKTKTNKVPLVGPRGRKELLDRIGELEKKVAELAANPPTPAPHILKIEGMADDKSVSIALQQLKLDGVTPAVADLSNISALNTVVTDGNVYYTITYLQNKDGYFVLYAGFSNLENNSQQEWHLFFNLDSDSGTIRFIEQ